jgi:hypothetical protein
MPIYLTIWHHIPQDNSHLPETTNIPEDALNAKKNRMQNETFGQETNIILSAKRNRPIAGRDITNKC